MKKLTALLLALAMILFLAACGGKDGTDVSDSGAETNTDSGSADIGTDSTSDDGGDDASDISDGGSGFFGEITAEDLMGMEPNPESDFNCYDTDGDGKMELVEYTGTSEIVVIPETWNGAEITVITSYTFGASSSVKAVVIPDTVTTIMLGAFGTNEHLEIVVCGSGLVEIGDSAFLNCTALREVVLKDGVTKFGALAFCGCTNLKTLEVPASVTDINHIAFNGFPEGFVIIGAEGSAAEEHANANGITFQTK